MEPLTTVLFANIIATGIVCALVRHDLSRTGLILIACGGLFVGVPWAFMLACMFLFGYLEEKQII